MPTLELPTTEQINEIVQSARDTYSSGSTRSFQWRQTQLRGLLRFLKEKHHEILQALRADLGKPRFEGLTSEIVSAEWEAHYALKNLRKWMKPEKVRTPLIHQPGSSYIHKDPLGTVLIIGAWNYPIQLTLVPLVGAIAGGNAAILKPSEISESTSQLLHRYLPEYLDPSAISVVQGGPQETTELLKKRFDHIFYTGNGRVGQIVLEAAAKHLTPVTLELGGKSPCIVDDTVDVDVAAKRIVWGKFFNGGQTCVAPDYLLVTKGVAQRLKAAIQKTVVNFWKDGGRGSDNYPKIVNQRHFRRIMQLLDTECRVLCGGTGEESELYIAPTVLTEVSPDSPVMREEIFGPVLPILEVESVDEAITFVNDRPKPLALYLYSKDEATQAEVLQNTTSGGVVVNHCLLHNLALDLPFGGVGSSGMGSYHGKASFHTFTHRKSVMHKPFNIDLPLIYPNFSGRIAGLVEKFIQVWRKVR